jgi:predicted ABC-type transport system involved in lysophospholipase L1 biosynthesis ATPase subunit
MPFNSTTHFHTMVALEQAKVNPADVQILNMRPPEVRAAWQRGDIQATFIWDPVLAEVKKDGKVILTSGQISAETGKATFDGYVVNRDWAKANRDFMVKFVKIMATADDKYRKNTGNWTKDSAEVKAVAKWSGAKPEDVPAGMGLYKFPTASEQATKWLGGGKDSTAAKALAATAAFQLKADRRRCPTTGRGQSERRGGRRGGGSARRAEARCVHRRAGTSVDRAFRALFSMPGTREQVRKPSSPSPALAAAAVTHALSDISLALDPGDFVVALGASGCGKTTLLSCIAGFMEYSAGEIVLDGRPVTGPGAERGVVFQKHALMPWLNVAENVAFGLRMRGTERAERRRVALDKLRQVGLEKFADPICQLSGGSSSGWSARALASDPEVMLMDEPPARSMRLRASRSRSSSSLWWKRRRCSSSSRTASRRRSSSR